jgi:hypothetical protein
MTASPSSCRPHEARSSALRRCGPAKIRVDPAREQLQVVVSGAAQLTAQFLGCDHRAMQRGFQLSVANLPRIRRLLAGTHEKHVVRPAQHARHESSYCHCHAVDLRWIGLGDNPDAQPRTVIGTR